MIEPDGADHRHVRIDDVGGIQPSAEPDLEHRHIDGLVAEQIERRERVVFEERERDVAARRVDPLERLDQARVAGLDAVDADALVVTHEMRRGESAAAQSGRAQQRVEIRDRRTLAVGAAHGHHAKAGREQVEAPRHFAHAAQAEIDGARVGLLLLLEPLGERAHAREFGYCAGADADAGCATAAG